MYDSILVPTDGSDLAERAVEHALDLATQYGSTVHALYVIDTRNAGRMSEAVSDLSSGSAQRQEAEQRRERAAREVTDGVADRGAELGVEVVSEVRQGSPEEAVIDYSEAQDVDLIVLGARGRTAVGKFLLGSVAGKVARHAAMPVLLVREDEY